MYVYLARGNRDAGNQFISIKKAYERPTGVHPAFSQCGSWLPILASGDKPVPMLLYLGEVRLPGYLCYYLKGKMVFLYVKAQEDVLGSIDLCKCNIKIPILKPGQCKRLSIKI